MPESLQVNLALYRKYRPQTFDDVSGQEHITETLKSQVRSGKLNHAYLFIGTRGTGKTTCARILAKAINCEHPVNGNPCNCCDACRGVDDGSLVDVVEMDAASNNGVDDVRMLREEAVFSPTVLRHRVYIIDEVHMLSKPAFNALLKILEEPPEHLIFILATTELHKVLPTILSRCQRHNFHRLGADVIADRLRLVAQKEALPLEDAAADLLGRMANGGMRDGLSLLDQCASMERISADAVLQVLGLAGTEHIEKLARAVLAQDAGTALELYEKLWQDGKEPATLLGELSDFFRDSLLLRIAPNNGTRLISYMYPVESLSALDAENTKLLSSLNVIQKYLAAIRDAADVRLQGELCLIEMCAAVPTAVFSAADTQIHMPAAPNRTVQRSPVDISKTDFRSEEIPHNTHNIPSPAPAAPAPPKEPEAVPVVSRPSSDEKSGNSLTWREMLPSILTEIPIYTRAIMEDAGQVSGEICGEELVIRAAPGFPYSTIGRPEMLAGIKKAVLKASGRNYRVRIEELVNKPTMNEEKLNQLNQFGIVTFKD